MRTSLCNRMAPRGPQKVCISVLRLFQTNNWVEFKEIRKEWKQKKKEEEAARKADEERQRAQDDPVRNSGQRS
jgi:hypothetical protein